MMHPVVLLRNVAVALLKELQLGIERAARRVLLAETQ